MLHQLTSALSPIASPPVLDDIDAALLRRIQKLSRRTQQVFLLSRLDRLPYAEIAQRLGIDIETVERKMVCVLGHGNDQHGNGQHRNDQTAVAQVPDTVSLEAHRWYVHLQSPHATASQRIEFRHWLDADLLHLEAFERTERLWRRFETPAAVLGANGWQRRKPRLYIVWLVLTAFLCSLLVTAEALT